MNPVMGDGPQQETAGSTRLTYKSSLWGMPRSPTGERGGRLES